MAIQRITPERAKELLDSDSGYIFIDVRTPREFDSNHVPGAKNIPIFEQDFSGRMQFNPRFIDIVEANFGRRAKIITGCQMGGRSLKAAEILVSAGFKSVVDMRGGFGGECDAFGRVVFPGWSACRLPTTKESAPAERYDSLKKNGRKSE
jgi:rhodanese-related sulfurtransferase